MTPWVHSKRPLESTGARGSNPLGSISLETARLRGNLGGPARALVPA